MGKIQVLLWAIKKESGILLLWGFGGTVAAVIAPLRGWITWIDYGCLVAGLVGVLFLLWGWSAYQGVLVDNARQIRKDLGINLGHEDPE